MDNISKLWSNDELCAMLASFRGVVTIGKRAEDGDARSFEANLAEFPLRTIEHLLQYGTQRGINDKCGGSDKTLAKKFEIAETILSNWKLGKVRKTRTLAEPSDPVTAEAQREARVTINALAKAGGDDWYKKAAQALELPFSGTDEDRQDIRDEAIALRAAKPENIEAARIKVEAAKTIKVTKADLGF